MTPFRPTALSMSADDWLLLVALSILWGGSFYFAKIAVLEIPPLTLALCRVGIAATVLAVAAHVMAGPFPRDAATWRHFTIMALFNNVLPFTLIFWGQIHISIGLASILNATSPLFGVLAAHVLTHDDRMSVSRMIGLGAGFAGVVVLIGPDLLTELGANVLAEFACLAAAGFYGYGAVHARRLRGLSPFTVAGGQLIMSTVLLLPAVALFGRVSVVIEASHAALWATVSLAVLSTALAYLIYFRIIARAGATNALLVTFLIPVSAILLGMLLLDETPDARQLLGMSAIFAGLAAIDGRPARLLAKGILARIRD
jgi:drug/metabolite transporter (DMT)-like permease